MKNQKLRTLRRIETLKEEMLKAEQITTAQSTELTMLENELKRLAAQPPYGRLTK